MIFDLYYSEDDNPQEERATSDATTLQLYDRK